MTDLKTATPNDQKQHPTASTGVKPLNSYGNSNSLTQ